MQNFQGHSFTELQAGLRCTINSWYFSWEHLWKKDKFCFLSNVSDRPSLDVENRKQVVTSVISSRVIYRENIITTVCNGRFLAYSPDENLFDGYAAKLSNGFVDDNNVPPSELWIGYVNTIDISIYINLSNSHKKKSSNINNCVSYLLSWVPNELLMEAEAAVAANLESCIWWVDEANDFPYHLLRQSGDDYGVLSD